MTDRQRLWQVLNRFPSAIRKQHIEMNIPLFIKDDNGKIKKIYPDPKRAFKKFNKTR